MKRILIVSGGGPSILVRYGGLIQQTLDFPSKQNRNDSIFQKTSLPRQIFCLF